uniref:Putative ATP /GTP-binding protein n=1 Tax=Nonomuraea gerenzanensis TaxID=93944 RepID=A0A1M4EFM8_9ACTN|nr:putative ATP /GTP-binding protein [Nonomuraea gerenzanensis]
MLLVLAVVLLALGLAGFLAGALGVPDDVVALLDQRASVISMVAGLAGLIVQLRVPAKAPSPRMVGLPRPPARRFVGRDHALRRLMAAREGGAGVRGRVICGLGGIGKSELALQYAHAHRARYELVWWIPAESAGQVRTGLAELGRALAAAAACRGPDGPGSLADRDAVAYALAWLGGHGKWLLVFDDVRDPEELEPYLGRLERGEVLITSRRTTGWDAVAVPISLPALPPQAAVTLLTDLIGGAGLDAAEVRGPADGPGSETADLRGPASGSGTEAANLHDATGGSELEVAGLRGLVDELGCLPLALVQAGGYIARTPGMTVTRYRRLLAAAPGRMHAAAPPGQSAADRHVIAQVWQVTRDTLAARDPLTVELLRLLACYAPDVLPMNALGTSVDVAESVALLAGYSMITLTGPGETAGQPLIGMHRLVHAVIRAELGDDDRRALRERAARLIEAALPGGPEDLSRWPLYARLLPHVRTVLTPDSPGTAEAIQYLAARGDLRTAHAWQRDRHTALHAALGPEHPGVLAARHDLAHYQGRAGDARAARDEFAALLPVRERVHGPEHPLALATRHALTLWTGQAGDPAAARDGAAALLPIRERVLGAEHPDTLITRHDLAYWTGQAGDPESARDQLLALLPVRERIFGPEHLQVMACRHVLTVLIGVLGDAPAARDEFAALARVQERLRGPDHPVTMNARHELARWTGEAGDPRSARRQFAALLPVRRRVQGPDHPDTVLARDALAYWEQRCRTARRRFTVARSRPRPRTGRAAATRRS